MWLGPMWKAHVEDLEQIPVSQLWPQPGSRGCRHLRDEPADGILVCLSNIFLRSILLKKKKSCYPCISSFSVAFLGRTKGNTILGKQTRLRALA